ncbi:MAG: hypothetical protein J6N92_03145 [Alloprevotella sp.]|nr:hypothetical protein [Alloprevotella sp.]
MKRTFFIVLTALTLAACNGKTEPQTDDTDTTAVGSETTAVIVEANKLFAQIRSGIEDPTKLQESIGRAQAKMEELLRSGDSKGAQQYTIELLRLIAADKEVQTALEATRNNSGEGQSSLLAAFRKVAATVAGGNATAAIFAQATEEAGTSQLTETAKRAEKVAKETYVAPNAADAADEVVEVDIPDDVPADPAAAALSGVTTETMKPAASTEKAAAPAAAPKAE